MAEINAKDVMKLRDKTGLPMMACKAALHEAGGDVEKAEELLRKQLKGKMDSRSGRAAGEGAIRVATSREAATIVEVRAETDFTAKSEKFQAAAVKVAELAIQCPSGQIAPSPAMIAAIDEVRISTSENCSIARAHKLTQDPGTGAFGTYVHHDGKTGVLVQAEGSISDETLRDICMHIAAADPRPIAVTAESLPQHVVDKERNFRIEQAMASGKPKEIAEKMVEGGMRKFYEEIALVEQPFIRDPSKRIKELVGPKARIVAFFRWAVGEEA